MPTELPPISEAQGLEVTNIRQHPERILPTLPRIFNGGGEEVSPDSEEPTGREEVIDHS